MQNKMIFMGTAVLLAFVCFFPGTSCAQSVKPLNPDCSVCPVVIAFEGDEARDILKDAIQLIAKLSAGENRNVKIDMDGIKKAGSPEDADDGYELLVFTYSHLIVINSIQDGGTIKISTDAKRLTASGASTAWTPEIQLSPASNARLEKDDDLQTAWFMFKESKLSQYISSFDEGRHIFRENFAKMILHVLGAVVSMPDTNFKSPKTD